jgi:hypothetical protein
VTIPGRDACLLISLNNILSSVNREGAFCVNGKMRLNPSSYCVYFRAFVDRTQDNVTFDAHTVIGVCRPVRVIGWILKATLKLEAIKDV